MIRVLHVDDNHDHLELTKLQLIRREREFAIEWAESAQEALARLREGEYDCVLSDYQMPEMDGLQLLTALREKKIDVPFVFLTGQGNEEIAAEALRAGADAYYTKDVGFAHYQRMINTIYRIVEAHKQSEAKREAENALRESETRYRSLFESSKDVIYISSLQGKIVDINPSGERLFGFDRDELLSIEVHFLYANPEDRIAYMEKISVQGYVIDYPVKLRKKDGTVFDALITATIQHDNDGNVCGFQGIIRDDSERQQAEKAVRLSEEKFALVFKTSPDAVTITRLDDGVFIEVNDGFSKLSGYTKDEVLGRSSIDLNIWADEKERHELARMLIDYGEVSDFDCRLRIKSGEIRVGLLSANVMEIDGRRYMLAMTHDITDRERVKDNLRQDRDLLRRFMDTSPGAIVVLDRDNKIVFANALAERILELKKDNSPTRIYRPPVWRITEMNGTPLPGNQIPFAQMLRAVKAIKDMRYALEWPDGRRVLCSLNATPLFDTNNEYDGVVLMVENITERLEKETALKETQNKYQTLINELQEGVLLEDTEGKINFVNPRMLEMLDYLEVELIGKHWSEIVPSDQIKKVREESARRSERISSTYESELIGRGGKRFPVIVSARPLYNPGGEFEGVLSVFTDITDRKKAEIDLQESRDQLAARTQELEAINKELEAFSYTVSHDLRMPLGNIDGFCHIIQEDYAGSIDQAALDFFGRIRSNVTHMAALIEEILSLSRMSTREMEIEPIDLSEMAKMVADELHSCAPQREVRFEIEPGLTADGDQILMRIILENLLGNAWKFTKSCKEAAIEFGSEEHRGKTVYYVRDNGIGFDKADTKRVFIPFVRLHDDSTYEGSGIGLATVQRAVRRLGGRVWAEGKRGEGATFRFTLG